MRHFYRLSATDICDLLKGKKVDVRRVMFPSRKLKNFPLVWGRGNGEMRGFLVRGVLLASTSKVECGMVGYRHEGAV